VERYFIHTGLYLTFVNKYFNSQNVISTSKLSENKMLVPKYLSALINLLFPSLIFRLPNEEKILYLTFDDGPSRQTTEFILDTLEKYRACATFFCLGENLEYYPDLHKKIMLSENQIANHCWKHKDALFRRTDDLLFDIERTLEYTGNLLFRPPYGRLWPWQIIKIQKKYNIIMWDVMIPDYKSDLDSRKYMDRIFPSICNGSIIVMHDSVKSMDQLFFILPLFLQHFSDKGFRFESIPLDI